MKISHLIVIAALTLALQGCKTKQRTPPPMPPSSSPPSSSSPPPSPSSESSSRQSKPSPQSDSRSSPPSTPTQDSTQSMPSPSSPGSQPSSPSEPAGGPKSDQQEAAENLKKAGQQIADASASLPGQPTLAGESQPQGQSAPSGGEPDPLMLPGESSPSGSMSDESGEMGAQGEPDDMMMEDDLASGSAGELSESDPLYGDIQAAQEALEQAGVALQTAGEALETAASSEELAAAEAALARARVAVIVAGQDLLDLQDIFDGPDQEMIIGEVEDALNEANVAIVIATDSIFSSRIDLPEFERQGQASSGSGEETELDKELNDSIVVFENQILEARNDVIDSAPAPTGSENIPGVAVLGGTAGESAETGTFSENEEGLIAGDEPEIIQQGRMPEGAEVRAADQNAVALVPDDIPDSQGDDIVAQQLREAAVAEANPDLRAKLWEEYKRYKAGL